jgi:hypothetical protein
MQIFLGEFVQVALWLVLLLHLVKIDEPSEVYFECGTCIQLQWFFVQIYFFKTLFDTVRLINVVDFLSGKELANRKSTVRKLNISLSPY